MDIFPPVKQREALLGLTEALGSRPAAVRRDENGDWRINGRRGWVYAVPEGYQLCFFARNGVNEFDGEGPHIEDYVRAKRALTFCRLVQDGTGEGIFLLENLPTTEQGETIREILEITKKRQMGEPSEAQMAARVAFATAQKARKSEQQTPPTDETDPPAPLPPDEL